MQEEEEEGEEGLFKANAVNEGRASSGKAGAMESRTSLRQEQKVGRRGATRLRC